MVLTQGPALIQVPAQPPPLAGRWTFFAETIVGAQPLGPIQLTAMRFTKKLSGFGQGSATVIVEQIGLSRTDLIALWTWKLWCLYDGVPLWCGVPSGIEDVGSATVTLTLSELSGYLEQRVLEVAYRPIQVEQTAIARFLATPVQDVGVVIVTEAGPGFVRDRAYEYLEGQHRAELLINLSNVISGPEFRTEYAIDNLARLSATLRIAYPRVGSGSSGLGATVPGTALGFRAGWDSDKLRTRTFSVGDLPEGAPPEATKPVVVVSRPQANRPTLDKVDDWPSVILVSSLTERANTNATIYAQPTLAFDTSTFESDPPLETYGVGDDVVVSITDVLLPGGLITTGRLVGQDVNCASGEIGWEVALTQPPAAPRATLAATLGGLTRAQVGMFRRNVRAVVASQLPAPPPEEEPAPPIETEEP